MPTVSDFALALVLTVVGIGGTVGAGALDPAARPVDAAAIALVVAAALATVVRRRWPAVVLLVIVGITVAYLLLQYPYGPIFFPFAVAVYTVARHLDLKPALGFAAVALVALIPHSFVHPSGIPGLLGIVPATAWVVVPFAVGFTVRVGRQTAQRQRDEALRDAVNAERLRIVQEVHDVVGHGLAAIKMQADIALHVLAENPAQSEQALTAISETSTQALDEVRSTLAVLRQDAQRGPAPGLHQVDALLERMRSAGLDVEMDTVGTPEPLPAAVDLAAYRILQESLTNVLKHADAKSATVRLEYAPDDVQLFVSNPVQPQAGRGNGTGGVGIVGMAERAAALGGTLTASPSAGLFEVHATLPVGGKS